MRRHFYVTDYADETLPCDATLEAWADWLSRPDESWPHEMRGAAAEGATGFVCRCGRKGWDGDTWSDAPLGFLNEAADEWGPFDEGAVEQIVCVREGPDLMARFEADGPRLVIDAPVQ